MSADAGFSQRQDAGMSKGARNHLFLEQGYIIAPGKSTFRPSTIREVFEDWAPPKK
jgi:hypothetical protein